MEPSRFPNNVMKIRYAAQLLKDKAYKRHRDCRLQFSSKGAYGSGCYTAHQKRSNHEPSLGEVIFDDGRSLMSLGDTAILRRKQLLQGGGRHLMVFAYDWP